MKRTFISSIIIILIAIGLKMYATLDFQFAEWYARNISIKWTTVIGRLFSFADFSVFEWIIISVILLLFIRVVSQIKLIKMKMINSKAALLQNTCYLFLMTAIVYFIFTISFGINYHRIPFYESEHIERVDYGVEELVLTCEYLTDQVNNEALYMRNDSRSNTTIHEADVERRAIETFHSASNTYRSLQGFVPKPKIFSFYQGMSSQSLMGISIPFTMEPHYNDDMPSYNIPDTICHELAHMMGFMREEEAGFIAFLTCTESPYADFRYSGYMSAYIYCMNDLYKSDPENYLRIRDKLCKTASDDLHYNTEYWKQHEGWFSRFSDQMNDFYLKLNHQEEGVGSYRMMTDLVVSYYLQTQ